MQRAVSATFRCWFCPIACLLAVIGATGPCVAETDSMRVAAETYDAAVAHFERAEYAAAAKLFLEADTIHPSDEAMNNAIAAARQANDQLLVAQIALRVADRAGTAPELAARARQALAEAEVHLSRLELSCSPAPCELDLDGTPVTPGTIHVVPGSHRVSAHVHDHTQSHDLVSSAGATYRISLAIVEPPPPAHPEPGPTPMSASAQRESQSRAERDERHAAPLPPAAFYAAVAATGVVTGLTIWSGLDALDQKRELEDPPSQASHDELVASVRRTDILLVSSVLLAAGTTYIGWKLVDFGDAELRAQVSPTGCGVSASGQFW
ncbi:MAG TPA: hypothetical protein VI197_25690 [Polyangiaceae bacterium]